MSNLITPKRNAEPGILGVFSNEKYDEMKAKQLEDQNKPMQQFISSLARHIRTDFSLAYRCKEPHHQKMIQSLKQRKGMYDAAILADIQKHDGVEVFIRLTDVKCRAAESWIKDILAGQDRPWLLESTPVPELSQEQEDAMMMQAEALIHQQGFPPEVANSLLEDAKIEIKKQLEEQAKIAVEKMSEKIDDQLKEGGFKKAFKDFIYDVVTFKAGILKGPVITKAPKLKWEGGQLRIAESIKLCVQRISPFDVFPGAYATDMQDGPLMIKHRLTYADLYQMIGLRGNKDDAIQRILNLYGSKGYTGWYEHIDSDREQLEGRMNFSSESNIFEAIEYRGPASGRDLLEWGIPENRIDDPLKSYEIEAWLIGHEVIRCVLNPDPLGRKPFYKASAVDQPGSWWGEGIPELIHDIQEVCNYVIRSLAENVSMASGPQVAIDPSGLPRGENITHIHAWKIWQVAQGGKGTGVPVNFFQPSMHGEQLLIIYERLNRYADDVSGIPAYASGSDSGAGAAKTASGLSMLLGSAARGIKMIIGNIDEAVGGLVERYYVHNMLFDEDMSIKGDAQVVAQGANALVQKETQQIRNMEMLQFTNNPIDLQIIGMEGRSEMLRHAFKTMDYGKDIIPDHQALQEKIMQLQLQDQRGNETGSDGQKDQNQNQNENQNQDVAGNPQGQLGRLV